MSAPVKAGSNRMRLRSFVETLDTRLLMTATTRDPWQAPFTSDSIWNTSIGSGATYVPAQLGKLGYLDADPNQLYKENASDPLKYVYQPEGYNTNQQLNVPASLSVKTGPNNSAVWLKTDGQTVREFSKFSVDPGANPIGYYGGSDNILTGDGRLGSHFGSGLSGIGGTLRAGELTDNAPIHHALQIELDFAQMWRDQSNPANMEQTYRWPATRSDGNFGGTADANHTGVPNHTGSVPGLNEGALLALAPSLTESGLGLKTLAGKQMFHALQDYGAYAVDSSNNNPNYRPNGGFYCNITLSPDAIGEFKTVNGYSFTTPQGSLNNSTGASDWYSDMSAIYANLSLISNNSSTSVGGGGTTRRGPAALPFGVTIPGAVSNLTLSNLSPNNATITWTDNASNETGYIVERATDRTFSNGLTVVANLAANSTSYTATLPSRGPVYYYRVRATNASGDSPHVAAVRVTNSTSSTGLAYAGSPAADGTVSTSSFATGNPGGTSGYQQSAVFAVQLPSFGIVANPFSTANLSLTVDSRSNPFLYNSGNKYILQGITGVASSSDILAGYYNSAATTLNSSYITPATFDTDPTTTNDSYGNSGADVTLSPQNITSWLNTQYAGGANAGKYVFLRMAASFANATYSNIVFKTDAAVNFTLTAGAQATNQITNGSFESDALGSTAAPTGWTRGSQATSSIVNTGVTDGSQAAKVTVSNFSSTTPGFQLSQNILNQNLSNKLVAGTTYKLTGAWSNVTGGFGVSGALYYNGTVYNFSGNGPVNFTFTYDGSNSGYVLLQTNLSRFSGSATTGSATFDGWSLTTV